MHESENYLIDLPEVATNPDEGFMDCYEWNGVAWRLTEQAKKEIATVNATIALTKVEP